MATDSAWGRLVVTLTEPPAPTFTDSEWGRLVVEFEELPPEVVYGDSEWGRLVVPLSELPPEVVYGDSEWGRLVVRLGQSVALPPDISGDAGDVVTITATSADTVSEWFWRQVSGQPADMAGSGASRTVRIPAAFPPDSTNVVLGVSARVNGIVSPESFISLFAPPHTMWYLSASGVVKALYKSEKPT